MEIVKSHSISPFTTKDGSQIRKILEPSNSSITNQSLAEATVLPGLSTLEHYHTTSEEIYYILKGSGIMQIEQETQSVTPFDGISVLPGKKHKITNTGKEPLVFLCCCSPPYKHDDTKITENR